MNTAQCTKALSSWTLLNEALKEVTEKDAERLLNLERSGAARVSFLMRLHARYNVLRAERERRELLAAAGGPHEN